MITPLDLSDVQLRSGRILEKEKPSVFIQEQDILRKILYNSIKCLKEHLSKTKILKKNRKNQ